MTRHRALQQCVRLAFGISCPEKYHAKNQIIMTEEKVASSIEKRVNQKTDLLKKVLQEKLKS